MQTLRQYNIIILFDCPSECSLFQLGYEQIGNNRSHWKSHLQLPDLSVSLFIVNRQRILQAMVVSFIRR